MTKLKNLYCILVSYLLPLYLMKRILAQVAVLILLTTYMIESVDASSRVRRSNPARLATTQNYVVPVINQNVYYYGTPYTINNGWVVQTYYYSPTYIQWYTYYYTPKPGYYYYVDNTTTPVVYTTVNTTTHNNRYYTPQNYTQWTATVVQTYSNGQHYYPSNYPYTSTSVAYPGCSKTNIFIWWQEWSSCNATDRNSSSTNQSGWFFAWDRQSSFLSYNGMGNSLAWQWLQTRTTDSIHGPCAEWYRLPTRSEWETAIHYARLNWTSLANLLWLSNNGWFYGYRDTAGNVTLSSRADINWSYWTSTYDGSSPIVLHLSSGYAGYRTDGTDYSRSSQSVRWQHSDAWLALVQSTFSEIANVRCIKK